MLFVTREYEIRFQQQIRFNNSLDYNNPVGQAGFNDKILEKLISYSRVTKSKNVFYYSEDYEVYFVKRRHIGVRYIL